MLFMEEMVDENVGNDHVEEQEEEMKISPPMNNLHGDDLIIDDIILAAFGNESGDNSTEKSLSFAQKVKRKLMDMVKIKKGLAVDSGGADHVMPIG